MASLVEKFQRKYNRTSDAGARVVLKKKTKLIAWFVSNCNSPARMRISDILKQILGDRFDRGGACFGGKRKPLEAISQYKFYLAVENSYRCRDYVTEKVFKNGFEMESVPVVWGARKSDYLVPRKSAIFVEDFGSVAELAEYLDYLDKNDTAYLEYFEWRTLDFTKLPSYGQAFQHCQLCRLMHGINVDYLHYSKNRTSIEKLPLFGYKTRNAGSIYDWMYGGENRECVQGKIPKIS